MRDSDSAPVAQLDRVSGYEPEGRAFESLRARQSDTNLGTSTEVPFFISETASLRAVLDSYLFDTGQISIMTRRDKAGGKMGQGFPGATWVKNWPGYLRRVGAETIK